MKAWIEKNWKTKGLDEDLFQFLKCVEVLMTPDFFFSKRNTFERGQSDVFRIRSVSVGILKKLRIEIDNQGYAPAWFLERVTFDLIVVVVKTYSTC